MDKPNLSTLCIDMCVSHCDKFILISITFNITCFTIVCIKSHFTMIPFLCFEFIFIPFHFSMIRFTLATHLIHDSMQRSNIITLKSNVNSFGSFTRPCVTRDYFASLHHNLDSCIFHFTLHAQFVIARNDSMSNFIAFILVSLLS